MKRRETHRSSPSTEIDELTLKSLVFDPETTNPITFTQSFEACFGTSVAPEIRSVRLHNFVPVLDREFFKSVWLMQPSTMYVQFRRMFIQHFLPLFMNHRKARLASSHRDCSSFVKFAQSRIETYVKLDGLDRSSAVQRTFLDLPTKIATRFFERSHAINEKRLLDWCSWADLHIRAQYKSAESSFENLDLNTGDEEASSESSDDSVDEMLKNHSVFYDLNKMKEKQKATQKSKKKANNKKTSPVPSSSASAPPAPSAPRPVGRPRKEAPSLQEELDDAQPSAKRKRGAAYK